MNRDYQAKLKALSGSENCWHFAAFIQILCDHVITACTATHAQAFPQAVHFTEHRGSLGTVQWNELREMSPFVWRQEAGDCRKQQEALGSAIRWRRRPRLCHRIPERWQPHFSRWSCAPHYLDAYLDGQDLQSIFCCTGMSGSCILKLWSVKCCTAVQSPQVMKCIQAFDLYYSVPLVSTLKLQICFPA